ncbi:sugar ABC transporter permease [Micromonospora sp. NPDC049679]|uniref:carbohydrate ABC transporter permease n=1 Tax=Micromonospora sp. NPDC049679 TaxID=3155920 RepID=UPI0034006793
MSEQRFAHLLTLPLAVVLFAVVIFPVLYSLYMSFTNINELTGVNSFAGIQNYIDALTSSETWTATLKTFVYVFWLTLFSGGIALFGALVLNEKFRGRGLATALVILPWAVSLYAAAVIWRYMYSQQFGMFNAILGAVGLPSDVNFITPTSALPLIALAHAWEYSPLGIYFMLATLQFIPADLYNLARTDRLSAWGRFRHVTLPYLKTPLLIFLILVTAEATKGFEIAYFISGGGPGTSSTHLVFLLYKETFVNLNLSYGAALSWILLVLVTVITLGYFWVLMRGQKKDPAEDGANSADARAGE